MSSGPILGVHSNKLYKTTYTYKFDYKEEKSVYSTAYYDHERPDYETTSSKEHKFDFDHKYGKFTGDFYNYMKPKQEQQYPS